MSYRNDSNAGYDHTILSSVPDPTRAEKQEGYNVDLLEESRNPRAITPPNGLSSDQHGPTIDYSPGAVSYARKEESRSDHEPVTPRVPWYRTRRGIIGIVVAVVIVVGAAVGGGVGGTRHSSHSSNSNASNGVGQSGSGNGAQQGVGVANSSTTSPPSPSSGVIDQVWK
ncbi:hypothetical protein B0F90DRAFT_1730316 [Multifurca ochricompacta]|uniref:Uncharacterized protein n=1 Tax=Multifurca ochricompacta TaxID=376703 RepID=A0AAD4M3H6_9AGAM|nr:hypothetical protein B0F90DRAFT_1730316 [Multifurca ochricompacta]